MGQASSSGLSEQEYDTSTPQDHVTVLLDGCGGVAALLGGAAANICVQQSKQPPLAYVGTAEQSSGRIQRQLWQQISVDHVNDVSVQLVEKSVGCRRYFSGGADDLTLRLPDECLACVFGKLSTADRNSCSLVCRRWHGVDAKSRSQLSLDGRGELGREIFAITLRFEHVTSLSLKCNRRSCSVDDTGLVVVGKNLRQLQRLKLKGCRALTDAGMAEFARICSRSLRKLSCSSCAFGAKGVDAVLASCAAQLEEVSMKRLKRLLENPHPIAGKARAQLRRLSLKDIFNAQLFGGAIAGAARLQTLILARNPGYWDHLFQVVAGNLTHLTELRCESLQMSDVSLAAISGCCRNLEVVYLVKLSDCTNHGLGALASGCRKIKKLYIDDRKSSRIGDAGLQAVASRCPELSELVLVGVGATESSLLSLASNCTALERVALCSSDSIRDGELRSFGAKCASLKKLCIKDCPISDHGLEVFSSACPDLVKVKVKKCPNVTAFAAFWLQRNRPAVRVCLDAAVDRDGNFNGDGDVDGRRLPEEYRYGHSGNVERIIRSPTVSMPCSSKFSLAAGSLLRKLPRSS